MSAQILVKNPVIAVPVEVPDGVITDFTTPTDFKSGTVSVWLYGMRLQADLETGFTEVPPNIVRMNEAPVAEDTIEIQYEEL